MKRKIAFVLTAPLMFGLTACGAANEPDHTGNSSAQTDSSQVAESSSSVQDSQDNGENSDVDAISSASVTEVDGEAKGLARTIAEDIRAVTGGDLFSIETSVDYPGDINELIEYASGEQEEDACPELTSHIENLEEYETIFVGYPLWLAYHNLIQCTQV